MILRTYKRFAFLAIQEREQNENNTNKCSARASHASLSGRCFRWLATGANFCKL